jgi:hypothetical protein
MEDGEQDHLLELSEGIAHSVGAGPTHEIKHTMLGIYTSAWFVTTT